MSKRVLILTDSLALPRQKPEYCSYESTWPQLLIKDGYIVHQVSIGGATSVDLLAQISYHKMFNPDLVIVQVGIVDCAPRFMTKLELSFFRRLGILGKFIVKTCNKPFVKKIRNITYVTPRNFKENIHQILAMFGDLNVFFIGIIPSFKDYEIKLPGITKRINQYNSILSQVPNYISMEDFDFVGIMSDFHHLNDKGHMQIFNKLKEQLKIF